MATRTFTVSGDIVAGIVSDAPADSYALTSVINITPPTREGGNTVKFDLDDESLAAFEFEDGTVWFADKNSVFDVFSELGDASGRRDAGEGTAANDADIRSAFAIPVILQDEDQQRSVGDIILKVVKIFKRKAKDSFLDKGILHLATQLENKQLQDHQTDQGQNIKPGDRPLMEGLFALRSNFEFSTQIPPSNNKPYLVLIHGTASSTFGSFGKLYGSSTWDAMVNEYGKNILAFQHRTLSKDPLENAEDLLKQLPHGAEVHLVTHSRGGLIADVLCRFLSSSGPVAGFAADELEYWRNKAAGHKYAEKAERLAKLAQSKSMTVGKVVRVACPASGTTLASKRIEYFFNVTLNLLGAI
ncbi:MAG TPA: hypothetical protein VK907_07125, partial [Phnomibacter sp.]|nr:hypothetical protein [Phnomibacter sp.]